MQCYGVGELLLEASAIGLAKDLDKEILGNNNKNKLFKEKAINFQRSENSNV